MFISGGSSTKNFTLYPPLQTKIEVESEVWINDDNEDFDIQLIFATSQLDEEDQILNLMNNNDSSSYCEQDRNFQEQYNVEYLSSHKMALHSMKTFGDSLIEIFPRKKFNINDNEEEPQKKELINMLQEIPLLMHGNTLI